jgi:hypothetical protein
MQFHLQLDEARTAAESGLTAVTMIVLRLTDYLLAAKQQAEQLQTLIATLQAAKAGMLRS